MVKNLPASVEDTRDMGLIPELGKSSGEGNDNSLQYSCLRNSMDQGTWWRKWQPIPEFLPGKSHGQRRLVGYSPWDCKELDMTKDTYIPIK